MCSVEVSFAPPARSVSWGLWKSTPESTDARKKRHRPFYISTVPLPQSNPDLLIMLRTMVLLAELEHIFFLWLPPR